MSSIGSVGGQSSVPTREYAARKTDDRAAETTKKGGFSQEAAVFEHSTSAVSVKNASFDRSSIVKQMQNDLNSRMNQMTGMVKDMMQKQGKAIGTADDIWSFLASGDFKNVDEAAVAQAKEDISENGYWGVDKTSSRIVDFAIALSGNDTAKADKLISAFQKGFDEATKAWGRELPSISKDTYKATMDKFDQWKNGTYQSSVEA